MSRLRSLVVSSSDSLEFIRMIEKWLNWVDKCLEEAPRMRILVLVTRRRNLCASGWKDVPSGYCCFIILNPNGKYVQINNEGPEAQEGRGGFFHPVNFMIKLMLFFKNTIQQMCCLSKKTRNWRSVRSQAPAARILTHLCFISVLCFPQCYKTWFCTLRNFWKLLSLLSSINHWVFSEVTGKLPETNGNPPLSCWEIKWGCSFSVQQKSSQISLQIHWK